MWRDHLERIPGGRLGDVEHHHPGIIAMHLLLCAKRSRHFIHVSSFKSYDQVHMPILQMKKIGFIKKFDLAHGI